MRAKGFTIKAYAAALATLALGIVLSLNLRDWTWFSRSGSLVVINGIILTSRQIIEHMRELRLSQAVPGSQFKRDWAGKDKHRLIQEDHLDAWKNEKYGLYMLIAGTAVWGFGDLINVL